PVSRVSRDDEARFVNLVRAGRADEALPLVAGLLVGTSSRVSPATVVQAASLTARAAAAVGTAEDRADALLLRAMSDSIREADRAVIQAEVLNLIEELCALTDHPSRAVDWPTLREYLETHFAEDLHLTGIAETFGVSERTLSSLVAENSMRSFPSLLNSIRCGAAKRLIAERPDVSLRVIAEQVGYRSERTFFRQFKAVTGLRPAEFKRQVAPRGNRH
ncbi:MAG: helix-turn-helix domain-containing protein, partial [bacterium]